MGDLMEQEDPDWFPIRSYDQSFAMRLEAVVGAFGENTALEADGVSLSFSELNQKANAIAHRLGENSPTDQPVALLLGNNAQMICAMFAVWKLNRIVIPLDPSYPVSRIEYILQDSGAELLITNNTHLQLSQRINHGQRKIVQIDNVGSGRALENVLEADDGRSGALLLYTSGSTGKPKGILHSHRNWLHGMSTGTAYHLRLNSKDRYALLHSCSFSAGIGDLLNAILYGATLCIWDLKLKGGEGLSRWMVESGITIFDQSPSLFRHFVSDFEKGLVWKNVRGVLLGSEAVTKTDFEIFKKYFSDECVFINRLGTTESLGYHLSILNRRSTVEHETVPTDIGVSGLRVEIDESTGGEDGVGEIRVHGDFLAIGYWNLPDETERRFKTDPNTGIRCFHTGDLGRFDEMGRLHFMGRNDFQIQIRGHRVEVAEIENAMNEIQDVQDCAVVSKKTPNGELRLVAFYEPISSGRDRQSIDSHLRERLPTYMVPAKLVEVEELPKTPSGKLDRRALIDWEEGPARSSVVEPRSEVEEGLVEVWKEVLAEDSVSVADNFFSLGGHSILVFRALALIRRKLGVKVSVSDFYSAQSLSGLAQLIEDSEPDRQSSVKIAEAPRVQDGVDAPASFAQKRLWLLSRLEGSDRHYHLPQAYRISGELDVEALREAMIDLVDRQQALRTVVYQTQDGVYQRIVDVDRGLLRYSDLSGLPEKEKRSEVANLMEAIFKAPFDLSADTMVRAALMKTNFREYIFVWCIHHISGDGWSLMVFRRELAELYEARISGRDDTLPPLPIQYTDYASAQLGSIDSPELVRQVDYWVDELKGAPELHSLPLRATRPSIQSFKGAGHRIKIDPYSLEQIKSCCLRSRTTLFAYMMACCQVLLYRYSGQSDLVVGTPVAGRLEEELENTIGFFANTLALRNRISGKSRFIELLSQVHDKLMEAFSNQSAPFEVVVEKLNPTRSLGHTPVFQTMLAMQSESWGDFALKGLDLETLPVETTTSKFDLTINVVEKPGELWLKVEYSTALFDRYTIVDMMDSYAHLASSFAADVMQTIGSIPIVGKEGGQELAAYLGEKTDHKPERVVDLFDQRVEDSADDTAVKYGQESLTYAEFSRRVDKLAASLSTAGVGDGAGVALFLDRSIDMVAGLLAVFKRGAYFVPLDPRLPDSRLKLMIEEADIGCFLTDSRLCSRIEKDAIVVLVDQIDSETSCFQESYAKNHGNGDDLAYVIFTSGSTGRPKGVAIAQDSLANLLCSMRKAPGITKDDTLLAITTISFDIAILELLLPLVSGATLIVAHREDALDGRRLYRKLQDEAVTVLQATPATWQLLLDAGWEGRDRIKALCGGEAMSNRLKSSLLETGCELWNLYGPTETTIWSAVEKVEAVSPYPTIGFPTQNTELYVLNDFLQIQPAGVWGELYIGGEGLAKGYVNRPGLTQAAFLEHPFKTGEKLYKTGDRVRLLKSGGIQYDGRLDNQVKVRGFRIELGEIESVLDDHADVERSIALVKQNEWGPAVLFAYVKRDKGATVGPAELRSWIEARLPSYMVPSHWVWVDRIPLTPNGKTDRKALEEMPAEKKSKRKLIGPRTKTEQALARIWRKELRVQRLSIEDNFFEIGGHSMLAASLFGTIERQMKVSLPLSALFKAPTIASLASYIDKVGNEGEWSTLVPIQTKGSRMPLFLVHGAEGNVLLYRELARSLGDDQPVYGFQAVGLDGVSKMANSIEEMATDYVGRIRDVQPDGPYCLGGYCLGGTIAFEMGRQLRESGHSVAFVGLFETYNMQGVVTRRSRFRSGFNKMLNIYFHLASLMSLPRSQRRKFFMSKLAVERSRLKLNLAYNISKWSLGNRNGPKLADQHLRIRKVNDRAQLQYEPKPYYGSVSLFKPSKNFWGLDDPYLGWAKVVKGDLIVHELPMYPRSMLTSPFTQVLAQELEKSLDSLLESV